MERVWGQGVTQAAVLPIGGLAPPVDVRSGDNAVFVGCPPPHRRERKPPPSIAGGCGPRATRRKSALILDYVEQDGRASARPKTDGCSPGAQFFVGGLDSLLALDLRNPLEAGPGCAAGPRSFRSSDR